jgi:hypothetical protein
MGRFATFWPYFGLKVVCSTQPCLGNLGTTKASQQGVCLIRTNLPMQDEVLICNIYKPIRQIEATLTNLKKDPYLRPFCHNSDKATMLHLKLGLLAYWLVNNIRNQLKGNGINDSLKEIVRTANTPKPVTTMGTNLCDKTIKTVVYSTFRKTEST